MSLPAEILVPRITTTAIRDRRTMPAGTLPGMAATRPATLSPWRIAFYASVIVGLLLVNKLGEVGACIYFFVLLCMVAYSSESAFIAFLLGALGLATNMAIVPKTLPWTFLRLVLLFACAARFLVDAVSLRRSLFTRWHYLALCLFVVTSAVCSLASGYYVQIALLKLLSFWVGLTAILGGVAVLRARKADLTEWFLAVAYAVAFNGLLAVWLNAAYGFRSVAPGANQGNLFFQGPYYHPNTCGPMSALFMVLLASTWLFSKYRNRWLCLPLIGVFFSFLWLSRSRTGLFALVSGMVAVFLLTVLVPFARRYRLQLNLSRTWLVALAGAVAFVAFLIDVQTEGVISDAAFGFITKYDTKDSDLSAESLLATRQHLIARSWQNFLERPLTGIGFEVSTDDYFVNNATLFSAPIEKGFLPTAILEEVGILGTVPFLAFLLAIFATLLKTNNAPGLAVFMTYLITNLGEVSIFAMGGTGALSWLLVGAAALVGDQCVTVAVPGPRPHLGR